MRVRVVIGFSIAALALISSARADQLPVQDAGGSGASATRWSPTDTPASAVIVQLAAVTQQVAQLASTASIAPAAASAPETATPAPVETARERSQLDKPAPPDKRIAIKRTAKDSAAEKPEKKLAASRKRRIAATAKELCVRPVGRPETGTAAWYGGRYVGRRTSSGERLDTVHPTAAHRTLPLNSLARVTNLDNGRSVIVRVTDRGPVSESLLIDMSPKAAAELHMKQAGLVPVKVEQVVEVPPDSK